MRALETPQRRRLRPLAITRAMPLTVVVMPTLLVVTPKLAKVAKALRVVVALGPVVPVRASRRIALVVSSRKAKR